MVLSASIGMESNEAEGNFESSKGSFSSRLMVESDSSNVIKWELISRERLWQLQYLLNKIKSLCLLLEVVFRHMVREANEVPMI